MTVPPLTVLMTVHNGGLYLRAAIDSILAQTYRAFRLLIVDDASSDNTPDIIRSYDDPRIDCVALPRNVGQTAAPPRRGSPGWMPTTTPRRSVWKRRWTLPLATPR